MIDIPGQADETLPQVEVQCGLGFTEPTKPYGNTKFYASIKITCAIGEQDAVMDFAEEWVSERCNKAMAEIKAAYGDN